MQKKIFFAIFSLCIAVAIAINVVLILMAKSWVNENALQELERHSLAIAPDLKSFIAKIPENYPYRTTIISTDGNVLFDNNADVDDLDNHLNREEIQGALQKKEAHAIRYSESLKSDFLYYATLVKTDDSAVILRTAIMLKTLNHILLNFLPYIIFETLIILFLCYWLAKFLTFKIVAPLKGSNLESVLKSTPYLELNPFIQTIKNERKIIKNQLNSLKQKQNQLLMLTQNMSDGFILLNKSGKVLLFNSEAQKYFPEIAENKISANFEKYLNENTKESQKEIFEIHNETIEAIFCPIFAKQKFKGLVIILRNISKEIKNQKLRREFSANVTHELKTPLTSILASAEMIHNNMIAPQDFPHFFGKIENEAQHLLNMINDILKLSFMDENQIIQKSEVDLKNIIENVVNRLNILAEQNNIKMESHLEDFKINGNAELLENLFYNLIDNAIRYNQKNGLVNIQLFEKENAIIFEVKDNGAGIPQDLQNRIFERFFRIEKTKGGTGLGLAIVKAIAERHSAQIFVESNENGSTFSVHFPR